MDCARMDRILVTGGAGFIGSNFVHHLVGHTDARVTVLDKLTYAASAGVPGRAARGPGRARRRRRRRRRARSTRWSPTHDAVVHYAAESHNDNSPRRPVAVRAAPTWSARSRSSRRCASHDVRYHHISTDEVYGDLELDDPKRFTEDTPYNPSSPYSATKAGSDLLVRAWVRVFGVRATISNCSNNYGPWQHIEKFIPRQITNVIDGIRPEALRRRARTSATGSTPTTTARRC